MLVGASDHRDHRPRHARAPAPGRTPGGRWSARAAAAVVLAVAVTAIVAGCLPSGGRGASGRSGTAAADQPQPTATPAPTGPTPRPSIVPPTPTPMPTFLVYVVAKGDSLNTIAHKFGTTARSIAFWNRATYPSLDPESAAYRPDLLKVGWTLFLIPDLVVDEEELPGPSTSPSDTADAADAADAGAVIDPADAEPTDPGGGPIEEPSDSAVPE